MIRPVFRYDVLFVCLVLGSCAGREKPTSTQATAKTPESSPAPAQTPITAAGSVPKKPAPGVVKVRTAKSAGTVRSAKSAKPPRKTTPEEKQLDDVVQALEEVVPPGGSDQRGDAGDFMKIVNENVPGFRRRMKNRGAIYPLAYIRVIRIEEDVLSGALVELRCVRRNRIPPACREDSDSVPPDSCEKLKRYLPCGKSFKPQHLALYLKRAKGAKSKLEFVAEPIRTRAFTPYMQALVEFSKLFRNLGIFSIDISPVNTGDLADVPEAKVKAPSILEFFALTQQGFVRRLLLSGDSSSTVPGIERQRTVKTTFITAAKKEKRYLVVTVVSKRKVFNTGGGDENHRMFCSRTSEVYIIDPAGTPWKKVSGRALTALQRTTKVLAIVPADVTEKGKGDTCPTIK